VKIVPAIHGTSEDIANSIITTGFVALSKLDSGYYGKGVYFTTSVQYALPYFATKSSPVVIICLVISGNAYPVIEHPDEEKSFMGAALSPGYHSHYVLTRKDGYPCYKIMSGYDEEQFFDELVIEQEAAILPFYYLKVSRENLSTLALKFQKEQEILRKEDFNRRKPISHEPKVEDDDPENDSHSGEKLKIMRLNNSSSSSD